MKRPFRCRPLRPALLAAALAAAGHCGASDLALTGGQEVPPVSTQAAGNGTITIGDDHGVAGSITTTGIDGTMAHIHQAAAGKNGPVIVPLERKGASQWAVPAGARLTDQQYQAFKNGQLYVNVHSAAHPGGEIRAQMKP